MWSLYVCVVALLAANAVHAKFEKEYVVVIEASAGDTFGSCYAFKRRDAVGDPIEELEVLGRQVARAEPLHFFASVGRLSEIKQQVQPLIDFCLEKIPKESQEYTSVFALMGGGVRSLNGALQRNVVTVVHQVLRLSCFRVGTEPETVIVLSAQEEAAHAFLGLNFINERDSSNAQRQLLIDLNSAVAATSERAGAAAEDTVVLKDLDNTDVSIYAPVLTFDGTTPLYEYLRSLPANANTRQTWPCLPEGYEMQQLVIRRGTGTGVRFTVVGASNPEACEARLATLMEQQLVDIPTDSPSRNLEPGEYGALGALETAITTAAAGERVTTPMELLSGAHTLCRRDWFQQMAIASETASEEAIAGQCLNAMWVALILRDAVRSDRVTLNVDSASRAFRSGAAPGFVITKAPTLDVGAPPRGVRCDELNVDLVSVTELPRLVMYQCDCVTFTNYQRDTVHHISSDALLRQVMPQFASAFLYPEAFAKMDAAKYPTSHRVCSTTDTPVGKYNYHCDVYEERMNATLIIREQRVFGDE